MFVIASSNKLLWLCLSRDSWILFSGIMSKAGGTRSLQFKLVEKKMPTTLGMAETVYLTQQQQNYASLSTSKFTPTSHIPGENLTENRLVSRW